MNIPSFVSRTPPPLPDNDEEDEEEEFGNYVIGGVAGNGTEDFLPNNYEEPIITVYNDLPHLLTSSSIKGNAPPSLIVGIEENRNSENSSSTPPPQLTKDDNFSVAFHLENEATHSSVFRCDNGLPEFSDSYIFEDEKCQNVKDSSPCSPVIVNHNSPIESSELGQELTSKTNFNGELTEISPNSRLESVTIASYSTNDSHEAECDNLGVRNEGEAVVSSSASPSFTDPSSNGITEQAAPPPDESVDKLAFESLTFEDGGGGSYEESPKYAQPLDNEDDDFCDFADFQGNEDEWENPESYERNVEVEAEIGSEESFTVEEFKTRLLDCIENNLIWTYLRFLEDTPALKYQWLSSASNHRLLSALKIDSRNIFCGPWNKTMKSVGPEIMPVKFASRSEAFIIGADPGTHHAGCHLNDSADTMTAVPSAHFDWEGSGLVNPFGSPRDVQILQCDIGSVNESQLSSEALRVIQSLPDLSYMTKTYLVFNKFPTSH